MGKLVAKTDTRPSGEGGGAGTNRAAATARQRRRVLADGEMGKGGVGQSMGNVDADANARVVAVARELMYAAEVDLTDPDEVSEAVEWAFDLFAEKGVRPSVATMAQALGMTYDDFRRVVAGASLAGRPITPECRNLLKRLNESLRSMWELYLTSEKGNPVKWIFLGKNYFGMKDQTERIEIREDPLKGLKSAEEIAEMYSRRLGKPAAIPVEHAELSD